MVYRHIYIYTHYLVQACRISHCVRDDHRWSIPSPRCKFMRFLRKVWAQAGTWWHLSCACFRKIRKDDPAGMGLQKSWL